MNHFYKNWNGTLFILMGVYFVQGAVVVSGMAEFLLTKNLFKFSWVEIGLLGALSTLTWCIKPVYGFLTDLVPLFSKRRTYYLLLASLLPFLGYALITFWGTSFLPIAFGLIIANIGLGFADVIADGIALEKSNKETIGYYQTISWRAKAVGIFLATLFSGMIIERHWFSSLLPETWKVFLSSSFPHAFPLISPLEGISLFDVRFTLLLVGVLPLITFVIALFYDEQKIHSKELISARKEIDTQYILSALAAVIITCGVLVLCNIVKSPFLPFLDNGALASLLVIGIWSTWIYLYARHLIRIKVSTPTLIYAGIFIFLWRFTPSFGTPWTDYYVNTLHISQEKLGLSGSLQPLAWIIGSFIYIQFLDTLPIKKVLFITVIVSSLLGLSQLTVATPALANTLGSLAPIKYFALIILSPSYFLSFGTHAFQEILTQSPIINLDAVLSFLLEILYIVSFLPLLKLSGLVTPKGVEASNFAILASIMNLGLAFGSISGGIIYTYVEGSHTILGMSYSGLHISIIIGALSSLLCLPILKKLVL